MITVLLTVLLALNAVWNFVVWPPFLRRISADPRSRDEAGRPTTFLKVHRVLIGTSLAIAVVSAAGAVWGAVALATGSAA